MARFSLLAVALATLAVTTVGCDDDHDEVQALDVSALDQRMACDDLTIVAARPDGSEALLLRIDDGLAAEANTFGEQVEIGYELPDERVTLRWVSGTNVFQGQCGLDSGESWSVDDRHEAVSGSLRVRLAPHADGTIGLVAEIDGLLLAEEDEDEPSVELMPVVLELGL